MCGCDGKQHLVYGCYCRHKQVSVIADTARFMPVTAHAARFTGVIAELLFFANVTADTRLLGFRM